MFLFLAALLLGTVWWVCVKDDANRLF